MKRYLLALGLALICVGHANAQNVVKICVQGTNSANHGNSCVPVDGTNPLPVTGSISATNPSVSTNGAAAPTSSTQIGIRDAGGNLQPASATNPVPVTGSFSASIAGFTPTIPAATAALAVGTSSSNVALPTGTSVKVQNTGSSPAHVRLSVGAGTAVTTDDVVQPGAAVYTTVGTGTFINAIADPGNSTFLNITGGAGLGSSYSGSGLPQTYSLLINTAVTGATVTNLAGGTYLADLRGTVGGASIAVQVTGSDGNLVTFTTLTSAGSTGPFSIGAGSSVKAVVSGGSPSALYLSLEGIGAGSSSGSSGGAVFGPTAVGSAAANPPVLMAGTANATATGTVQVAKVDSSGNVSVTSGVAQGSTTSGQSVSPIGAAVTTSTPTYTNGQTSMPTLDTSGNLRVNCATGCSAATNSTKFTLTAAASTNATSVKASAGSLRHISVYNNSATLAWVSFYNTAATPTCGTSIVYQTMIPANSTSGGGAVEDFAAPLDFSTGIGICVTTGIAGTGSVAATSYVVNLGYN